MKKSKLKVGAKAGAYSAILTVIVVAAAIVVNLIVNSLPSKYTRIDTTAESLFTFDEKTEQFVASLTEDVTVYHIASEGYEDSNLTEVLTRYSEMNPHIRVEVIDPVKNPTFIEENTEETVSNNSLIIKSADRTKLVPFSDIYYIYSEEMYSAFGIGPKVDISTFEYYRQAVYQYYGQTLSGTQIFAGESAVASGIDYVTTDKIPKLYILGDYPLNSTMTEWLKYQNYETETLTLTEEKAEENGVELVTNSVPEDASMLVITSLTKDLTEAEVKEINAFVGRGGDLVVLSHYSMASLENYRALAATYGIDANMSLVLETDSSYYTSVKQNVVAQAGEHPFVSNIQQKIYMNYAQGLKLYETMPEGMSGTVLLSTSDGAFAKKVGSDTKSPTYQEKGEGDTEGPLALGVLVECEGAGNVVWLASNYYYLYDMQTGVGACMVLASAINGLCGEVETVSIRTVEMGEKYLNVTDGSAGMWGVVAIGIIPLAFIGVGFALWLRRRSK